MIYVPAIKRLQRNTVQIDWFWQINSKRVCSSDWLRTFDSRRPIPSSPFLPDPFSIFNPFSSRIHSNTTNTAYKSEHNNQSNGTAIDRWGIPLFMNICNWYFWYCFQLNCLLFGFDFFVSSLFLSFQYFCGLFTLNWSRYFATALAMMMMVMMTIIVMIECKGNASVFFLHNYCWSEHLSRWLTSFCFSLLLLLM